MLLRFCAVVLLGPTVLGADFDDTTADAPVCNCDADIAPLKSDIVRLQKQVADLTAEATSQQQQFVQETTRVKQQLADATAEASSQQQQLVSQRNELLEAKKEAARVRQQLADATATTPFSFVQTAVVAWEVGSDGAAFFRETKLGEKVSKVVVPHFGKAKALAAGIVIQAGQVNYSEYVEGFKTSGPYVTYVAPRLETAWSTAQPYWHAYGKSIVEQGVAAYGKFRDVILPSLKNGMVQVWEALHSMPKRFSTIFMHVDNAMARLFDTLSVSFPKQFVAYFPTNTTDRIIFLFLCSFFGYHIFAASWKLLRMVIFVSRTFMKVILLLFRFCVLLPLKITRVVLRFVFCVGTCGCCCGLCRRKRPKELVQKAVKSSNGTDSIAVGATVEELVKLLEAAKKGGKLDAAAKQLVQLVKSGKAMTTPKSVAGKKVTKDVVTKTFASFKELDIKKLDL